MTARRIDKGAYLGELYPIDLDITESETRAWERLRKFDLKRRASSMRPFNTEIPDLWDVIVKHQTAKVVLPKEFLITTK